MNKFKERKKRCSASLRNNKDKKRKDNVSKWKGSNRRQKERGSASD